MIRGMRTLEATRSTGDPPDWALLERHLIELQGEAIEPFLDTYLDDDGGLYWPADDDYVGVDGHDDPYEGFYTWPLVYAVGGDEALLTEAKRAWETIVETFADVETPFGHPMAVREYEQCRDWFHQGEANQLLYNIGLADPDDEAFAERAERFAGFYLPDSEAGNYDPEARVVRAPQNGSMGPDYANPAAVTDQTTFGGYGADYRWAGHGSPFRDVPELESVADLQDPENEERLFELYEERCSKGDVPLNLNVTSLLAHAYLYTGEERYREWVREYVDAWAERTEENGGIVPDNVGLSGEIGEYVDGRWYGGFYGWTWGGYHYTGIGPTVGAENDLLLSGDDEHLAMPRSTLDALMAEAIDGAIPHKHGPPGDYRYDPGDVLREDDGEVLWRDGWYEFQQLRDVPYPMHLWYASMDPGDRERLRELRPSGKRTRVDPKPPGKHGHHDYAWLAYLDGEFPAYPERVLRATYAAVQGRLAGIRADDRDPSEYTEDYLRNNNPVAAEALLQLVMGAPKPVYYGGLLQARVRHFDRERGRPGLPPGVAALVEGLDGESVQLRLVNIGSEAGDLVVQAGAYGEHTFTTVSKDDGDAVVRPDESAVAVSLPPNTEITLDAAVDRFDNDPSYAFPI